MHRAYVNHIAASSFRPICFWNDDIRHTNSCKHIHNNTHVHTYQPLRAEKRSAPRQSVLHQCMTAQ
jgi:hypothetical protein